MQEPRQLGVAALFAVASACLVIGGLALALAESGLSSAPTATSAPPSSSPSPTMPASPSPTWTPSSTATLRPTITLMPTTTPPILVAGLLTASPTICAHPAGWVALQVQTGDTLSALATRYGTTSVALLAGNCMTAAQVVPGATIYVPPAVTKTFTAAAGGSGSGGGCVAGAAGWSKSYVVASGDTLFRIASSYYTTVTKLKQVNCRTSDVIYVGEVLWVPNVATRTPTFGSDVFAPQPTLPLTSTPLPFTGTPLPFTSTPSTPPT